MSVGLNLGIRFNGFGNKKLRLQMTDLNILSFYGRWQFSVCLFAFLGLMAIWWHIGRKQKDFGQVWLALSILCWSFSGLVEVIYSQSPGNELDNTVYLDGWRSIFSLLNSLFILLALPWFRYIPAKISPIIKSDYWRIIVGLPFLFCLIPTLRKLFTGQSNALISELDVYYAFFTLFFLGYILWESFWKRRLKGLAYLSILAILITVIAQLYKLTSADVNLLIFSAIFKTNLIMIFFALALSWVRELSELKLLNPAKIFIRIGPKQLQEAKAPVWIKGVNNEAFEKIILTRKRYELLYLFAEKKLLNPAEGWLMIKPQGEKRQNKVYDIQEHKEYLRIIETLLDATYGKDNWTKELHEKPLIDALFSKPGNRRIRLAIPAENIALDAKT